MTPGAAVERPAASQPPAAYESHLLGATRPDASLLRGVWEPGGVLEFPYAPAAGVRRLDGVEAVCGYFTTLPLFGPFAFSGVQAWWLQDDGWLVELHGSSTVLATAAAYEQDYIVRFGLSGRGRIAWMREYWDAGRL